MSGPSPLSPLRRSPQKPSRGHKEPPMNDGEWCRGIYEGARTRVGNSCSFYGGNRKCCGAAPCASTAGGPTTWAGSARGVAARALTAPPVCRSAGSNLKPGKAADLERQVCATGLFRRAAPLTSLPREAGALTNRAPPFTHPGGAIFTNRWPSHRYQDGGGTRAGRPSAPRSLAQERAMSRPDLLGKK
jgi:hypothetical protein